MHIGCRIVLIRKVTEMKGMQKVHLLKIDTRDPNAVQVVAKHEKINKLGDA